MGGEWRGYRKSCGEYFQVLFTATNPGNFDDALRYVTKKVTTQCNESLTRDPSDEEIKKALFDINPEKAPGPDFMTSMFYQNFWGITAWEIFRTVKEFFSSATLDARLNQTNICLIPKKNKLGRGLSLDLSVCATGATRLSPSYYARDSEGLSRAWSQRHNMSLWQNVWLQITSW